MGMLERRRNIPKLSVSVSILHVYFRDGKLEVEGGGPFFFDNFVPLHLHTCTKHAPWFYCCFHIKLSSAKKRLSLDLHKGLPRKKGFTKRDENSP
jgi:hypothetical protein